MIKIFFEVNVSFILQYYYYLLFIIIYYLVHFVVQCTCLFYLYLLRFHFPAVD